MQSKFADVLESVEGLPRGDKEMLLDILQRRLVDERRTELRTEIDEANQEFRDGECKPATADEIMDEVLS